MHKTRIAAFPVPVLFLLAACTAQVPPSSDESDTDGMTDESSSETVSSGPYIDEQTSSEESIEFDVGSSAQADVSSAAASSVPQQAAAQPRVISIQVTNWSFSPGMIAVKKGEKVQLKLVGGEGIHSFAVPGLGLNIRVEPGKTVVVDLPTDIAGTFEASCRIPCGSGHSSMKATIVIS